ncbi:MFS transporter [Spirosoma oryzicola]|uniref:MFS transporter n=1 Tax=Spirosoma oryzicola TaxID=2898794 RepID=UPI001E4C1026|nr:MFS transporter [Spirosoma oryzicola]UHG90841.1 MFS transporter [Spirosoma oryzicola]
MTTSAPVQTRSPLQNPLFRTLWIASMVSNIGTWVQNTGGSWLMTNLTTSSTLVALMQTATTLPVLFAALPAGTLADFFNKRSLLIGSVIFQIIVGIALTVLTYYNLVGPSFLLFFTFLLGLGNASFNPVWQSLTPEIVGRDALPSAVALNGALTNVSRSVGPAIGGLLVAQTGYYAVFATNALSSVYMLIVLIRWRTDATIENKQVGGNVWSALGAGIRYARYSEPLRGVLAHALLFVSFASCIWALLPLIARQQLHFQASGYGSLLGMMGAGSITGVFLLSRLRQRFNLDTLLLAGGLGFACILAVIGFLPQAYLVMPLLYVAGFCWLIVLTSLNISAQYSAPTWVKARVLAIYLLVFQGGMAIFSFLWGALNHLLPLSYTLATAGVGLVGGSLLAYRYKLHPISEINHQPALAWPDPEVIVDLQPSDGPVLVTIDYTVETRNHHEFLTAMQQIGRTRLRDGALEWDVYQDLSNPSHFIETFQVGSWAEHLQQHQHLSQHDYHILQSIKPLINGQPVVHHLLHQRAPVR